MNKPFRMESKFTMQSPVEVSRASQSGSRLRQFDARFGQSTCRQQVPNYERIFNHPIIPPDPPDVVRKTGFYYRNRRLLWRFAIFTILSMSALAFMKSDFVAGEEVYAECGP
jgi:hypothetical protein